MENNDWSSPLNMHNALHAQEEDMHLDQPMDPMQRASARQIEPNLGGRGYADAW